VLGDFAVAEGEDVDRTPRDRLARRRISRHLSAVGTPAMYSRVTLSLRPWWPGRRR
jgi:hypothetical protein